MTLAVLGRGATVIVAGDFNIQAPGRSPRVGLDPGEDCRPRGSCESACGGAGQDGYDDSVAMLLTIDGARLLSSDLPETFIGRSFPGGAIDHILVAGEGTKKFGTATTPDVTGSRFLGSDHRPVLVLVGETEEH